MRYWIISAGRDGRGSIVRFCYTKRKDSEGYFRIWREVQYKNREIKRFNPAQRRSRKGAIALAHRRATAYQQNADNPHVLGLKKEKRSLEARIKAINAEFQALNNSCCGISTDIGNRDITFPTAHE